MNRKVKKNYLPPVNLNLNVRGLGQSSTLAINELSKKMIRDGKEIFKLGLGQSPFPVPDLVVEELKNNAYRKEYLPVKGLYELRKAIADYYQRREKIECTAEDVLIGPGSKELMFLLQLVYYGDLVIPIPSWVSYAPQANIIGRHIRWLPTYVQDKCRLSPDELEKICESDPDRPRIVILNYPNNPSGSTYRLEELKALASVARKYRVILLSDEIYGEVNHTGQHISIARFYPEGTIISSGLSKWCGAGGWRLGTFTFPSSLRWLLDAIAAVASETYTSTNAPVQYAAISAFVGGPEIDDYLRKSRRVLRTIGRHIYTQLLEKSIMIPEPKGGFYLFLDFSRHKTKLNGRNISTSDELTARLLEETGVAILPGSAFGCKPEDLSARLAYVDFDGERALAAANEIKVNREIDFLKTNCDRILEAVHRICDWLDQ